MLERLPSQFIELDGASQNPTEPDAFVTCESCGGPVLLHATGRPRVHAFCDKPECRRRASAARARASRAGQRLSPIDAPLPRDVRTIQGNNSALIAAVARLYLPDGAIVADVTYAHGVFWRRFNGRRRFTLIGSDVRALNGVSVCADFRQLPYPDATLDAVVLDPPYMHCGHYLNNHRYGYGVALMGHMRHRETIELYRDGMLEGRRVLRPGGTLWVKCKDEIDSGQHWTHHELKDIAEGQLQLRAVDLFVLAARPAPTRRWRRQLHARKTHSYLWIFRAGRGGV